ncbi:MAG: hypothetical protein HRT57_12185 [Crocinitomicaceae bacterium]|nr:hypothetical protein [Crocinitomicaceae bacterium]
MKYLLILFVGILLASCGTQIAYTSAVREEFGLESEAKVKKVQFMVSTTVKLVRSSSSGNQGTDDSGVLVSNSSSEEEIVTIPIGTYGVFEEFGENEEIVVRFEIGPQKVLHFTTRAGQPKGKFFILADWKVDPKKGGKIQYGNQTYYVAKEGGSAYLMVLKKKLHKTKKKDRIVKGIKI